MWRSIILVAIASSAFGQSLPVRWDELTASDWQKALEQSASTCILPVGVLEKHGPHAPMGSDMIYVRELAKRITEQEYAVVFPEYIFGQIYEAKHQPGTFALPSRLVLELLEATCEEIARNGFKKIMIVNGHGGNPHLLRFFVQAQLERRRDYVVYFYDPGPDPQLLDQLTTMHKSDIANDMHAGEIETSSLLSMRPDLVQLDHATTESGENLQRLSLPNLYTAIWWYASFPNHYAGEGAKATKELGDMMTKHQVETALKALRAVKGDTKTQQIQNEFFDRVLK